VRTPSRASGRRSARPPSVSRRKPGRSSLLCERSSCSSAKSLRRSPAVNWAYSGEHIAGF
jgi:hypothetical protein